MPNKIIVAIDGYSSCGKSTIAKGLAKRLNYIYIDTGAMYRATTLYFLNHNIDLTDDKAVRAALGNVRIDFHFNKEKGSSDTYLNGIYVEDEIREMRVSSHVSPVSTLLPVRGFLVDQQRAMAEAGGVILDGRDIGTHVFPDAELKIFMTASFEIRTKRRYDELTLKVSNVSLEEIEENLSTRDRIDSTRAHSPLRMADDARELDNSDLSISDQLDLAMSWIEEITLQDSE